MIALLEQFDFSSEDTPPEDMYNHLFISFGLKEHIDWLSCYVKMRFELAIIYKTNLDHTVHRRYQEAGHL